MESAISMTNTVIESFTSGASFDFADLDALLGPLNQISAELSSGNVADEEDGTATATATAADTIADSTDETAATATTRPVVSAADSLAAKKARGKAARKNAKRGKTQKSRLMIAGAGAAIS